MTGSIVPSRVNATDPAEHTPPAPWLRFYVLFIEAGQERSRTQRTQGWPGSPAA